MMCTNNLRIQVSVKDNSLVLSKFWFFINFFQENFVTDPNQGITFNNGWNFFSIMFKPRSRRQTDVIMIIDNKIIHLPPQNFDIETEVQQLYFYNNFIGQATSILFMNKFISEDYIKLLKDYQYGLYSEKKILHFLKNTNNAYMNNSNLSSKIMTSQSFSEGLTAIIESLKFCYVPCRTKENTIYDICEKYNAKIETEQNLNGIHTYNNYQKNIHLLGGINVILPLIELICIIKIITFRH